MTDKKDLSTLQYNLEWEDHLYDLYGDFTRRNNPDEWIYFLRRPELAESKSADEIAVAVLKYITAYRNVSQEIVQAIEKVFRYSENREKYENELSFEALEFYVNILLGDKEFPPYDLFDGFTDDVNYDAYVDLFNQIYYAQDLDVEDVYAPRLKELKEMGVNHPYEALLESEYYFLCGSMNEAVSALKSMPNGYHKYMTLGNICAHMNEFENAETYLMEAIEHKNVNLDGQLIGDLIMCKWYNNKPEEALDLIEGFISTGYAHIVMPIKKHIVSEIANVLMEKGKDVALTEKEFLLIKEYYKLFEDYANVIHLCEISWHNGFADESWTVDITEAYFETGEHENAQKIIDMVLDGSRPISVKGQLKIREIRARLLFESGKIKEAYEVMNAVCGHPESDKKQQYVLAKMYMKTGNYKGALKFLKELHYYQSNELKYKYDMAVCFLEEENIRDAVYLLHAVCSAEPDNVPAAKAFIQAAIDDDNENSIKNTNILLDRYKELLTDDEKKYYQGQIFEMEDKCKDAQKCYKAIIDSYEEGTSDFKLLNDSLVRYFVMRTENNGKVGEMEEEMLAMLTKYPGADELWTYLANFYEETDYKTECIEECCVNALKANHFNSEARIMLNSIYVDQENDSKAMKLLDEMILYTDWVDAYLIRAHFYADAGEYEKAKADIMEYKRLGGNETELLDLNATIAMFTGDYELALDNLEKIKQMNKGKSAPAYDEIAICMCKLGRYDEAEAMMDVACEGSANPVFHQVLYNIQVYNGNYKAAKKTLKRYRKALNLGRTDEWLGLLSAYADLQDGKGQKAYLASCSMIEPEGERFNGILELFYGKSKAAVKLLKSALKNEPENPDNYSWLAFIYYINGDHDLAAKIALDGLDVLKETCGDMGKYHRCEDLCQYAFLKMMCGETDEAMEMFQRAADQPTCPEFVCGKCYEAYAGMGICHAIKGEILQANQAFDESLKENPDNEICKKIRDMMC